MSNSLTILADAAISTGMGHWVRSTALADELYRRGWSVRVVHRDDATRRSITDAQERGWRADTAAWTPRALRTLPNWDYDATIIVDSYRMDAEDVAQLRSVAGALVVIDDLADRGPLDADLIVNQNLGASRSRYEIAEETDLLLGPRFALLRPQFAAARQSGLDRVQSAVIVREALIMMGGTDATGALPVAAQATLDALPGVGIRVIAPPRVAELLRAIGGDRLQVVPPTPNIAAEMIRADLVISAGGTSVWELCATARPFGVVVVADNQVEATCLLEAAGAAKAVGKYPLDVVDISARIADMARDANVLGTQARTAAQIVDGLGSARVADRIEDCARGRRKVARKADL